MMESNNGSILEVCDLKEIEQHNYLYCLYYEI